MCDSGGGGDKLREIVQSDQDANVCSGGGAQRFPSCIKFGVDEGTYAEWRN